MYLAVSSICAYRYGLYHPFFFVLSHDIISIYPNTIRPSTKKTWPKAATSNESFMLVAPKKNHWKNPSLPLDLCVWHHFHTAREISPSNIPRGLSLGARLQPLHNGLIGLSNTLGLVNSFQRRRGIYGETTRTVTRFLKPYKWPSYLVNRLYSTPLYKVDFRPVHRWNKPTIPNERYDFGLLIRHLFIGGLVL